MRKGQVMMEEQKLKISEANRGRKLTAEQREKIRRAAYRRWALMRVLSEVESSTTQ